RLSASCALAGAPLQGCADNDLQDFRVDGSYYWRHRYGVTVEYFNTTGSANPVIYAANRTFTPDSAGVNVQLDTTLFPNSNSPLGPRFNARIGVQYTGYAEFNGAGKRLPTGARPGGKAAPTSPGQLVEEPGDVLQPAVLDEAEVGAPDRRV